LSTTYTDLVKQTFDFPQKDFAVKDNYLQFNGLEIKKLIDKYGTPFKLTFLPKIGMQIASAKKNVCRCH
jgi:arginine decarboxylase